MFTQTTALYREDERKTRNYENARLVAERYNVLQWKVTTKAASSSKYGFKNSLVFLLIGLEIQVDALLRSWRPALLSVVAVLVGRAFSVYLLVPVSNALTEKIPVRWQHVIVWGGLRGALALALALSLDNTFPDRARLLDLTFGVVVFSILVQGLTIKPLLRILRLASVT